MENNYTFFVEYSVEDEAYIAVIPDLPFCTAFGDTPEEAVKELMVAKKLWLESAAANNEPIPAPAFSVTALFSETAELSAGINNQKKQLAEVREQLVQLTKAVEEQDLSQNFSGSLWSSGLEPFIENPLRIGYSRKAS